MFSPLPRQISKLPASGVQKPLRRLAPKSVTGSRKDLVVTLMNISGLSITSTVSVVPRAPEVVGHDIANSKVPGSGNNKSTWFPLLVDNARLRGAEDVVNVANRMPVTVRLKINHWCERGHPRNISGLKSMPPQTAFRCQPPTGR